MIKTWENSNFCSKHFGHALANWWVTTRKRSLLLTKNFDSNFSSLIVFSAENTTKGTFSKFIRVVLRLYPRENEIVIKFLGAVRGWLVCFTLTTMVSRGCRKAGHLVGFCFPCFCAVWVGRLGLGVRGKWKAARPQISTCDLCKIATRKLWFTWYQVYGTSNFW